MGRFCAVNKFTGVRPPRNFLQAKLRSKLCPREKGKITTGRARRSEVFDETCWPELPPGQIAFQPRNWSDTEVDGCEMEVWKQMFKTNNCETVEQICSSHMDLHLTGTSNGTKLGKKNPVYCC